MLPSQTMPIICSYRRAHDSVGEKPYLQQITRSKKKT